MTEESKPHKKDGGDPVLMDDNGIGHLGGKRERKKKAALDPVFQVVRTSPAGGWDTGSDTHTDQSSIGRLCVQIVEANQTTSVLWNAPIAHAVLSLEVNGVPVPAAFIETTFLRVSYRVIGGMKPQPSTQYSYESNIWKKITQVDLFGGGNQKLASFMAGPLQRLSVTINPLSCP